MIKRTQEWLPFGLNNSNQQERWPSWDVDTGHQKFLTFVRTTFISYTDHVRSIPIQCMMIISQLGRRLTSKNQRPLMIYSERWPRFAAFIQGFISNIGLLAIFALILDFTFWLNFFRQLITRCTFTHLGLVLLERRKPHAWRRGQKLRLQFCWNCYLIYCGNFDIIGFFCKTSIERSMTQISFSQLLGQMFT